MLKTIPPVLGPDLLKILMEMGHGDELVIADGNFPAAAKAKRLIRMDGLGCCEILEAVLKLLPLDHMQQNVMLMEVAKNDTVKTPVWNQFDTICKKGDGNYKGYATVERFEFYERSEKAYAIIATSEKALYANIILKKGIV